MANRVQDIIQRGTRAAQPAANTVATGTIYYVTDEEVTERSTGSAWEDISDAGNAASPNDLLDGSVHQDTAAATVSRGSLIVGNSTPAWSELVVGTSGQVLTSDGTDATWQDAAAADFSDVANQPEFIEANITTLPWEVPGVGEGHIWITIDGGGSAITTGVKGDLFIPFPIDIQWATLIADQSGSIVIDVWSDSLANHPPTDADTITASAPPTLSTAISSQDFTLTGWTTVVPGGNVLRFNVDSITTVTRVQLILGYQREDIP